MLKFQPLCWIYHDTWKWKQTKIIVSPTGQVSDLSKTYTHPGHIHLFFDGKDVSKTTNTKAYTGTQDYSFKVKDVWGPDSQDPNQIQSFRMVGSPIWYIYVEQYWRRMYVQSWDYETDLVNGIHDGHGGIKYDASKPQHTLGPFREGAQMFFFNTTVNRTLPVEYYLNEKKSARRLYVKDSSNSNDTSGGQVWHFSRQGQAYNWASDTWIADGKAYYWYFLWYFSEADYRYYPQKEYTDSEKIAKTKAQQFFSQVGTDYHSSNYIDDYGKIHYLKTVQDCYGISVSNEESNSNCNDERHHPYYWNGRFAGTKKTSRINNTDNDRFNGTNAKRIHKDGQNMISTKDVLWQAYTPAFQDEKWYKFMTQQGKRWRTLTHFYSSAEFESWKTAFQNWQKNKLNYRYEIDYGDIVTYNGEDYSPVKDMTFNNEYSYDITWHAEPSTPPDKPRLKIDSYPEHSWYDIIGIDDDSFGIPKYGYNVPTPLPQDYCTDYSTFFDNEWVGYYEYKQVVKYKGKYYRRMWKPYGYDISNFGYDNRTGKYLEMIDNVITEELLLQNYRSYNDNWYIPDNIVIKQYSLHRRRFFPNPPPDGLPYDGDSEHDMYWEYMMYFGKIKGASAEYNNDNIIQHYGYNTPPGIFMETLEYDDRRYPEGRYWYDNYRVLWGTGKYHKIDMSKYTDKQIKQWKQEQGIHSNSSSDKLVIPYAAWDDTQKQACFYKYLDILYAANHFQAFQDKYSKTKYDTDDENDYPKIKQGEIPTYLQFFEFCNIWQPLTEKQVARLDLTGDMPKELSNASEQEIQACFNTANPLDPFTLSNSAITAWLKKYNHRQIYTIPEDTYCKGDFDIKKDLHPYFSSYSEQDGARRYYPDDKYLSPIIEYQKIIQKNWTLYNSNSYDILNDTGDPGYVPKWKYCQPQELDTDPVGISISIPFVDIQGNVISPFSENKNSPTLPIGEYSRYGEKIIPTENKMRYHVEWYDTLAQVKKYNLPEYVRLINLWNTLYPEHQASADFITNVQPPTNVVNSSSTTLQDWFYQQSTSTSPYFSNSIDDQGNIIHTPLIPVTRRNDEDTHVIFNIPFTYTHTSTQPNPDETDKSHPFIEVSNSYQTTSVYRSPTTQLCVTDDQIAKEGDNHTYGYKDSSGKIRLGGNIVTFNDPYHKEDGKWFEQCLGAIVKAKAIVIFENGMGYRWYEQVTTTELQSDAPLRGLDY